MSPSLPARPSSTRPSRHARSSARARWPQLAPLVALVTVAMLVPSRARATGGGNGAPPPAGSDMQITMTASAGFVAGGSATYTLTAKNNGPQSATGTITVTDTLPAGLSYTSAVGTGWTCTNSGQVVTCTTPGPVGNKVVLPSITLVAAISLTSPTSVTNRAHVTNSGGGDTNLANNVATVTSPVTVRAVSTTPDGATVSQLPSNGTNYTQLFTVTNTGNIADSYTLAATVAPAGVVSVVSVNGVGGTTGATGVVAVGATSTVTVVYSVLTGAATGATATLTLTATSIAVAVSDPGSLVVTVVRAGLAMSKQLYRDDQVTLVTGPANVKPGEYVQYKVTVTSSGVATASTVSVADPIPAAVTYVTATGDLPGWTLTYAAGTVNAALAGTLATGASRFFWIRVRVK